MSNAVKVIWEGLGSVLKGSEFTLFTTTPENQHPISSVTFKWIDIPRMSRERMFEETLYELFLTHLGGGADCTNFTFKKSALQGVDKNTCAGVARAFEEGYLQWRPSLTIAIASPYSEVELHFTFGKNLKNNVEYVGMGFAARPENSYKLCLSPQIYHTFDDFMSLKTPNFVAALEALSKSNETSTDALSTIAPLSGVFHVH